jgi:nicotinamide riboside transporter PnuC
MGEKEKKILSLSGEYIYIYIRYKKNQYGHIIDQSVVPMLNLEMSLELSIGWWGWWRPAGQRNGSVAC